MRLKCDKIERLLSDYIDGILPERQAAAVALHLRTCRSCKREVLELKKTHHLLENFYVEPEASDAYYARFTTHLQQRIEQGTPTAFHQRFYAVAARLGWHLLTHARRGIDRYRPNGFLAIKQHVFPYYVLVLTMTMLLVVPLLLKLHDREHTLEGLYTSAKTRFFDLTPPASVQPTATLAIKEDKTTAQSADLRRNVSGERVTETLAIDSGSDVWHFTDEPMTEGYIFTVLQKDNSGAVPNAALDIDSELLAYAEIPTEGMFWARLTSREVLTESRYALLLLKGIHAGQHGLQQYERKWSGSKSFSQKLLDVPLEILSIPEVSIEL